MRLARIYAASAAMLALLAAGCSQQTINSANKDVDRDIKVAEQQADKLAAQAKPGLQKLDTGARVTAALKANENLKGAHIRVDADQGGVKLRGSVKSAAQKTLAGHVARETLGDGKSVENDLKVAG